MQVLSTDTDAVSLTDVAECSDILLKLRKVRLRIASRSMVPTLMPGDEIAVDPKPIDTLQIGDLLLFRHKGKILCHRLAELCSGKLRTRGDATAGTGEWISPDQVLGKVVDIRKRTTWVGLTACLQETLHPSLKNGLSRVQRSRTYQRLMQPVVAPFLSYHLGIPQGPYGHLWHSLNAAHDFPELEQEATRAHVLVAKCAGGVAGWTSLVCKHGIWRSEHVFVRIRYRGLGIDAALTGWAGLLSKAHARERR